MWRKLWQRCRCVAGRAGIRREYREIIAAWRFSSVDSRLIVVHLVPTRPSLRVGTLLIVLGYGHMQGLGRGNPRLRVLPAWITHVVFLGAQRERSRKKAGNWAPMSILGFQQFAHGSALSGGGRARYL
jgi:hypothetical protein